MNLLNIVTVFNWIVIAILVTLLLIQSFSSNSGSDAAGRGMEQGFFVLGVIAVIVLIILNLLPYPWARYLSCGLVVLPFVLYFLSSGIGNFYRQQKEKREYAKPIFPDTERDLAARAIIEVKPQELKRLLETPPALLNEGGELLVLAIDNAIYKSDQAPERVECVRLLFDAGARLDSIKNTIPIHITAANYGNAALLQLLLEQGADANAVTPVAGYPILFDALSASGQPEACVRVLLDRGADPNKKGVVDVSQGITSPLVRAAQLHRWGVCIALLERGADADFQTEGALSLRFYLAKDVFFADENSTRADYERLKKMLLN